MNRPAQIVAGAVSLAICAAIFILPLALMQQMPGLWLIVAGAGFGAAGLWLVAPVGFGGFVDRLQEAVHTYRRHEEDS